ncbi:MAG TPA: DUF4435 domain-containing protein [Chloroflexi bacterium]|nr:DUF4435 domain-containing protein [Chloroflexota bacterium]
MSRYPSLTDIEIRWRSAGGVCVIVEGETEQDDVWFYNHWFGHLARQVTFFAQDGWGAVVTAVTELRQRYGNDNVFGIVDRDFEPVVVVDPLPSDGILRTSKYTLENYLLNPDCWEAVVRPKLQRDPVAGWMSRTEIEATLKSYYMECLQLSAFNWVLRTIRVQMPNLFVQLPLAEQRYREHHDSLRHVGDVYTHWQRVQTSIGATDDLADLYQQRLTALQRMSTEQLAEVVSGKYVFNLLRNNFPVRYHGRKAWDSLLSEYLYHCPDAPHDIAALVNVILAASKP